MQCFLRLIIDFNAFCAVCLFIYFKVIFIAIIVINILIEQIFIRRRAKPLETLYSLLTPFESLRAEYFQKNLLHVFSFADKKKTNDRKGEWKFMCYERRICCYIRKCFHIRYPHIKSSLRISIFWSPTRHKKEPKGTKRISRCGMKHWIHLYSVKCWCLIVSKSSEGDFEGSVTMFRFIIESSIAKVSLLLSIFLPTTSSCIKSSFHSESDRRKSLNRNDERVKVSTRWRRTSDFVLLHTLLEARENDLDIATKAFPIIFHSSLSLLPSLLISAMR